MKDFIYTRPGTNIQYKVEIFDELESKGRYSIVVKSMRDANDRDRIPL